MYGHDQFISSPRWAEPGVGSVMLVNIYYHAAAQTSSRRKTFDLQSSAAKLIKTCKCIFMPDSLINENVHIRRYC